jgi:5-hydroxyisourate hydrolase
MSPITTHVLDTATGRPAEGVVVVLEQQGLGETWTELGRGPTNADGRLTSLAPDTTVFAPGVYRLRFLTGPYFASRGLRGFYPEIPVHFHVDDPAAHYHVPLLLSPFGYSTYRGS